MADGVEFSLVGMDEVLGRLDALSHDVKYKGGRFALRKAAQLVARAAANNAKKLDDAVTGRSIADNIVQGKKYPGLRFSTRAFKATGDVKFRVGVSQGAVLPGEDDSVDTSAGGPTPHWRLLEFGTERMAAQPFMRKALAENVGAAIAEFAQHYGPALDRALKRAKKRVAA